MKLNKNANTFMTNIIECLLYEEESEYKSLVLYNRHDFGLLPQAKFVLFWQ